MIMRVYFVTQKDFGSSVILKPKIPESSPEYEGKIPRICVSTSILGALSSIGGNLGLNCNTYIYKCDLDDSEVIQPGNNINDIDMTGELWILVEKEFELYEILKLKKVNSFCIDKEKDTTIFNFEFDIIEKYI